jgi:flagellar motor switch protein FliN/FliY
MAEQDDIDAILNEGTDDAAPGTGGKSESALDLDNLSEDEETGQDLLSIEEVAEPMRNARDLDAVYDIPVNLQAVLGRASMQVSQLLKLGRGAVVELDRKVGEAIDIYVNNRLVARGEVVVVEERLGVTMTEIIKSDRHK